MIKIGVFDSGVGGLSVAQAIQKELPDAEVLFANDTENVPYGTKKPEVLLELVTPILEALVKEGCQVIVVACNTVTTTLIKELRERISVPLVGMEPMVKPAAELTKSNKIAIFATPATLASKRYAWLKEQYAQGVEVLEPDCSDWALMIETNDIDRDKIAKTIDEVIDKGADVIVLGCTHYHWIENIIRDHAKARAEVLQPEVPVIRQLKKVLEIN